MGSHVAEVLLKRGYTVRCLARPTSSLQWFEGLPIERAIGSLADEQSLYKAVEGADLIVHIAGLTAARNREEFFQGNQIGTRNLINAVLKTAPNAKRFLHTSSLSVNGPATALDKPVVESDPYHPLTVYAESKKAAEDEVFAVKDALPVTIVRAPAVYGQRDTAILSFFQTVNKGLSPRIGFDEKYISLVHAEDLARGIVDAAEAPNTIGEAYFVSSEEFYTWDQVTQATLKAMHKKFALTLNLPHPLVMGIAGVSEFFGRFSKKPPVLNYEKGIDITQRYWICSVEKANRDFGYRQQVSLEEGVNKTVVWYKEHSWL